MTLVELCVTVMILAIAIVGILGGVATLFHLTGASTGTAQIQTVLRQETEHVSGLALNGPDPFYQYINFTTACAPQERNIPRDPGDPIHVTIMPAYWTKYGDKGVLGNGQWVKTTDADSTGHHCGDANYDADAFEFELTAIDSRNQTTLKIRIVRPWTQ